MASPALATSAPAEVPDRSPGFRPSRALRAIPPYVFWELDARKRAHRARGRTLVDLGIGSPDLPVPNPVIAAMQDAAGKPGLSGYPAFRGYPPFLQSAADYMADRFGVHLDPSRELLAVAGSKEGLSELILSLCDPGDVVLIPAAHYPVYARAPQLVQAEAVPVSCDSEGRLQLELIDASVLERARMLIANYPCNPTTATADVDELARLVEFARRHSILFVSDMAYAELAFDGYRPPSALEVPGAIDCTVELHSTSKSFNMAGLRVGFVAGNADVLAALDAYRTNTGYGTSTLPQIAAAAAFDGYRNIVPPIVAEYTRRRDALVGEFCAAGWDVKPPKAAMYLWLSVPEGFSDWGWVDACLEGPGVVVTPGLAFGEGGRGRFRLSLVQPPEVLVTAARGIISVVADE